ncbi:hypothetical protein CVU76_03215 [Candidatus Dojkabacteria bacterium HGW-Dojkabacteria-1]|uniref:Pseudouridine synthase RsuA/RluA-like domain-containing protein n=1 Tax=Candidatus Dojkabacteria bacterium HGW-Dojkabacteria-1 TaxID=2013761 RepID=A0A2N2F469_9BACT|nr:MAG: hypothetical protein CVU76_03215 [Candidatus Dojkabacteria bacterium HGW-Dojkabacteria-1]
MRVQVEGENVGKRIDMFVMEHIKKLSLPLTRNIVQNNLHNGCKVNNSICKKSYRLREGDEIFLDMKYWENIKIDLSEDVISQSGDLDVRYEDENILVLFKPKGISVHPGVGHREGTLANFVREYLEKKGEYDSLVDRGGIVHRLDKGVSGFLVIAKNKKTQEYLKKEFQSRNVIKIYHAQVERVGESKLNMFKESEQELELKKYLSEMDISFEPWKEWFNMRGYIGRSSKNRYKMEFRLHEFGGSKFAESYLLMSGDEVLVKIETGRMHQIRASLEYLGLRIVGDELYGSNRSMLNSESIMLEAVLLSFVNINGERLTFRI